MGMHMDLQDCAFGHEQAMKEYDALQAELAALRAENERLRGALEIASDAKELAIAIMGIDPESYIGGSRMRRKAEEELEENMELIAAHDARLLDEAAERVREKLVSVRSGTINKYMAAQLAEAAVRGKE